MNYCITYNYFKVKSEEWGGEYIDILRASSIANKSMIKATIIKSNTSILVSVSLNFLIMITIIMQYMLPV